MHQESIAGVIRKYFAAFLAGDRQMLEEGLTEDFTFTSPRDDHINKATFFARCLPGSEQFLSLPIEKLFVQDHEALVLYHAELKNGMHFRNTEFYRLEGTKIQEVQVFFGSA
jgi:ketosteroid isomerase-like protein